MAAKDHGLLHLEETALLVVDVQERFRAAMDGFELMLSRCVCLVRAFRALQRPILVTEQYPKGLGSTVPELLEALGPCGSEEVIFEKTSFSSYGCEGLPERLRATQARSVLVCGIETHVCVNQSAQDLLEAGYRVQIAVDAVESRHARDKDVALRKLEREGVQLTTSEMAAFELLRDARHPKFKEVQALFK